MMKLHGLVLLAAAAVTAAAQEEVRFSASAARLTGVKAVVSTAALQLPWDGRPPLPRLDVVPGDVGGDIERSVGWPSILPQPLPSNAELAALAAPRPVDSLRPRGLLVGRVLLSTGSAAGFEVRDDRDRLIATRRSRSGEVSLEVEEPGFYFGRATVGRAVEEESFVVPATARFGREAVFRFMPDRVDLAELRKEIVLACLIRMDPPFKRVTVAVPPAAPSAAAVLELAAQVARELGAVAEKSGADQSSRYAELRVETR